MVQGVNKVSEGRYNLPGELADEYDGEYLIAWINDRGNIELKPARGDE